MYFKNPKIGGILLLISQMLERITFYSIQANFVYILNSKPLGWSSLNSMNASFLLMGFFFVATMIGGVLSDTVMKKSTTVIIGYILYLFFGGYIAIFFESQNNTNMTLIGACSSMHKNAGISRNIFDEKCANLILLVTFFCAIGSGLIKSVNASIGSDMAYQKWENPSVFFTMYYWSLNFGTLISFAAIAYVQQNVSRFYGYLAPGIILIMSFGFFLAGMPYYINVKKPSMSTLHLVASIYYQAIKRTLKQKSKKKSTIIQTPSPNGSQVCIAASIDDNKCTIIKRKPDNAGLVSQDESDSDTPSYEASTIVETTVSTSIREIPFLDRSKIRFGGTFKEDDVENIRKFKNLLQIFLFLIPYWIIYFQMQTTYLNQAFHMKMPIKSISIPACWLSMMDILIIMFLLPILVKFVYPYLRRKHLYPSNYLRIAFGMSLGTISMILAGILEILVLTDFDNGSISQQLIGNTVYNHSNVNVFYQLPQIMFMGLSESQAVVAGLELACTQVPNSMQGLTNGIFWFISGVGSFLSIGLINIFQMNDYYTKDTSILSNYYFFWITILQMIFLVLFIVFFCRLRETVKKPTSMLSVTNSS